MSRMPAADQPVLDASQSLVVTPDLDRMHHAQQGCASRLVSDTKRTHDDLTPLHNFVALEVHFPTLVRSLRSHSSRLRALRR